MSAITNLFSAAIVLLVMFLAGYVMLPSNSCERVGRVSNVAYAVMGLPAWVGERTIKRDMTGIWSDIENMTLVVHHHVSNYFETGECPVPSLSIYGRKASEGEGASWMKENDPELYKMIEDGSEK